MFEGSSLAISKITIIYIATLIAVPMRLLHLHLPQPIPYKHSLRLQESYLQKHFAYNARNIKSRQKGLRDGLDAEHLIGSESPPPLLLTFETLPTYTVGRRHLKSNPLSKAQIDFLTSSQPVSGVREQRPSSELSHPATQLAEFYASPRGGLLTYHAPGQLTAYLIYNLRYHGITPRCHVRMLEKAVIATCGRHGVNNTLTTSDPGVWIGELADPSPIGDIDREQQCATDDNPRPARLRATDRKICAIGVHVSRGITSHGIGLNVLDAKIPTAQAKFYEMATQLGSATPTASAIGPKSLAPGYLSWGFNRIVACGLEGKSVTWLEREQVVQTTTTTIESVANSLADLLAVGLSTTGSKDVETIERITQSQLTDGNRFIG